MSPRNRLTCFSALIPIENLGYDRKIELCVNLLITGCLWDIEEAKSYAKRVLVGMHLTPAIMLDLARRFAIHEWVEAAVKELVPQCGVFTTAEADLIGAVTLNIMISAQRALQDERLRISYSPPALPTAEELNYGQCSNHRACHKVLRESWWTVVGKKVMHPVNPMALHAIGAHLNTQAFPGMTRQCHQDMVNKWTANTFEEDGIIEGAVAGVLAYNKFLRPA